MTRHKGMPLSTYSPEFIKQRSGGESKDIPLSAKVTSVRLHQDVYERLQSFPDRAMWLRAVIRRAVMGDEE